MDKATKNRQPDTVAGPGTAKVLILGTGIAGLSAALRFAALPQVKQVTLVAKDRADEGATRYAQGGIATVLSKQDSFEEHKQDTLVAGAGLCHEDIVDLCVREGPARVRELIDWGVPFTKANPQAKRADSEVGFDLHREGGHGKHRILHADDLTGLAIEETLLKRVGECPNIRVLEHHIAVDLITEGKVFKRWRKPGRCLGAYVLNTQTGEVVVVDSDITLLATGGAGKVYLYTSNPDTATGDGIAMAYRAGARVANLEFMQFHPTCLYHPAAKNFLITEAMRGEGAILRTVAGEDFMKRHHPMGSLAPRDIVARAIDVEMKRSGDKHVVLDCTHLDPHELRLKFPNINEMCLKFGIDFTREMVPVVPATHYTCGGVLVDEHAQTTIEGLYAIGEVACTGLHGANRLASNSLLEAVVFSHRAIEHARSMLEKWSSQPRVAAPIPQWDTGLAVQIEERIDIAAIWLEIRSLMWNYVGIVRSNRRLERAKRRLELLKAEVNEYYWDFFLTKDLIELRNLLLVAELIVQCAALRKESRGLHYMVDYPETNDQFFHRDTVL
ncbi:MAG: L-aspartate oxidase [Bacteriovoracia bacterium]